MSETPSSVRNLVEQALATYDISITGELSLDSVGQNEYEVEVPFEGEMILEEIYENYGPLLYNKEEGELSLKGVRDGKLLLTVKPGSE